MDYRVSIEGPGLKVEREVDEPLVLRIMGLVLGPAGGGFGPRPAQVDPGASPTPRSVDPMPGEAPREFLDRVRARTNSAKIVALGLVSCTSRQAEFFGAEDIRNLFVAAGEGVPRNLARDIRLTVQAGWIAPAPGRDGSFYVTTKGKDAAAAQFDGSRPARRRGTGATREGNGNGKEEEPEASVRTRKRTAGATTLLGTLVDEGFFKESRTTQQILDRLHERGHKLVRTDLTQPLLSFVQAKPPKLHRKKVASETGRPIWGYNQT